MYTCDSLMYYTCVDRRLHIINSITYEILTETFCSQKLLSTGSFGPYRQSERKDIYRKYADELIARGFAYPCFSTDDELDQKRAAGRWSIGRLQV